MYIQLYTRVYIYIYIHLIVPNGLVLVLFIPAVEISSPRRRFEAALQSSPQSFEKNLLDVLEASSYH